MGKPQTYQGIDREENPNWLGWVILDLLDEKTNETEENIAEIKRQLDYEVRQFKSA